MPEKMFCCHFDKVLYKHVYTGGKERGKNYSTVICNNKWSLLLWVLPIQREKYFEYKNLFKCRSRFFWLLVHLFSFLIISSFIDALSCKCGPAC